MYTVDYFINKFTSTRDDMWCVGALYDQQGRNCANGWCGFRHSVNTDGTLFDNITNEVMALWNLFIPMKDDDKWNQYIASTLVADINNGKDKRYQQDTPKKRILAALYDIKNAQQPKYNDITKELAVLPTEEVPDLTNIKTLEYARTSNRQG